ncbi:uncharacterized protein LOC134528620 [Bacillus rossius redtenbacheri]|uniref:uncharacterized protein LOC134528620 n=1 Tax=Bacillus rossius redtenbacheri TaxID=93214 RepID=UPI002FDD674A
MPATQVASDRTGQTASPRRPDRRCSHATQRGDAMERARLCRSLLVSALLAAGGRTAPREEHYVIDNSSSRRLQDPSRVRFGDFPFVVFVERRTDTFVCLGSVVSQFWVVTSAQMIGTVAESVRSGVRVRAGSLERGRGGVLHDTAKVVTHPLYDQPHMYENDIALVKVRTSFTHDNYVKPIKMATLVDSLPPGTSVKACGWGKGRHGGVSQFLLQTTLQVVSNRRCDSSRGITSLREKLGPQVRVTDTMLCAASSNKDTTTGDSGGPLFLLRDEKPLLVGVISWGEGMGDVDTPGVYTSIAKYRKWMFLEMASEGLLHAGPFNDTDELA